MSRQPRTVRERIISSALILIFLPLILPLIVVALVLFTLHRIVLYLLVWMLWLPKGKDTLFVYSDSPIWYEYMTQQVLPLVEERAIVLNWSERSTWRKWRLTQQVFYSFGRHREFNPMVIMFRPLRRAKLFRFWSAFKDWKRGYTEPVERLRNDLRMSL
jgi:Na+-translocating ferredoxin:NAD+ oxidoreductase RnfA subunit